jgi:hypothetical protein
MRIFMMIVCWTILFTGAPAWKADALVGYYRQFHRSPPPKKCPNGFRWDPHTSVCRRIA